MEVYADREGFVTGIHTEEIGRICLLLGGGRAVKEDPIDPAVGIVLHRKIGDFVKKEIPLPRSAQMIKQSARRQETG